MFQHSIVRTPARSIVNGLTTAGLGPPDYEPALQQHGAYVAALRRCGLEVTVLAADERFPDSTFVEDTALLTGAGAIMANPGAPSRKGEVELIRPIIEKHFPAIAHIRPPGTLEPGDVLMVDSHFFIGLSSRTNEQGARQLISYLQGMGYTGSTIELREMLHLKTGAAFLPPDTIIACGELIEHPDFQRFTIVPIEDDEAYAANCLWINGAVRIAAGFPRAAESIKRAGYETIELDMSEFQKVDGGLSCLSLRW